MLFNFAELLLKHDIKITGLLHIGAHDCSEVIDYATSEIQKVLLVEANPFRAARLKATLDNNRYISSSFPLEYKDIPINYQHIINQYEILNLLITDKDNEELEFHMSDFDGGVDSIFKINDWGVESSWAPYQHKTSLKLKTATIDTLLSNPSFDNFEVNFLNLDIEGAELLALQGATNTLKNKIKYILCETQTKSRFNGSCLESEITKYLEQFGFVNKDYLDTGKDWGDTLYVKCN